MTNEEAIAVLENMRMCLGRGTGKNNIAIALAMAIAVLGDQPSNEALTCNGCMSFGDGCDHTPCFGCKRSVRESDCYRRPPEKGEHHA